MCGGTEFDGTDHILLSYGNRMKYCPGTGFFKDWSGLETKARACLACGYIAVFVVDLDALREQAG
jgi:hypothetical protein